MVTVTVPGAIMAHTVYMVSACHLTASVTIPKKGKLCFLTSSHLFLDTSIVRHHAMVLLIIATLIVVGTAKVFAPKQGSGSRHFNC